MTSQGISLCWPVGTLILTVAHPRSDWGIPPGTDLGNLTERIWDQSPCRLTTYAGGKTRLCKASPSIYINSGFIIQASMQFPSATFIFPEKTNYSVPFNLKVSIWGKLNWLNKISFKLNILQVLRPTYDKFTLLWYLSILCGTVDWQSPFLFQVVCGVLC